MGKFVEGIQALKLEEQRKQEEHEKTLHAQESRRVLLLTEDLRQRDLENLELELSLQKARTRIGELEAELKQFRDAYRLDELRLQVMRAALALPETVG